MTSNDVYQYVVRSAQVIEALRGSLHKTASEVARLKRGIDDAVLAKVASAVHTACGSPSNIPAEKLVECWKNNPTTLAETLQKFANDAIERSVSGTHIGQTVEKKASNVEAPAKADEAFWERYK